MVEVKLKFGDDGEMDVEMFSRPFGWALGPFKIEGFERNDVRLWKISGPGVPEEMTRHRLEEAREVVATAIVDNLAAEAQPWPLDEGARSTTTWMQPKKNKKWIDDYEEVMGLGEADFLFWLHNAPREILVMVAVESDLYSKSELIAFRREMPIEMVRNDLEQEWREREPCADCGNRCLVSVRWSDGFRCVPCDARTIAENQGETE